MQIADSTNPWALHLFPIEGPNDGTRARLTRCASVSKFRQCLTHSRKRRNLGVDCLKPALSQTARGHTVVRFQTQQTPNFVEGEPGSLCCPDRSKPTNIVRAVPPSACSARRFVKQSSTLIEADCLHANPACARQIANLHFFLDPVLWYGRYMGVPSIYSKEAR